MVAFVEALGNVSGKTIGNIRKELLAVGPVFPERDINPAFDWGQDGHRFMSLLYPLKEMLSMIPEDFAAVKDAAMTFLNTISGLKQAKLQGEIIQAGIECRGVDPLYMLPSEEDINAADTSALFDHGSAEEMAHLSANAPFWMRAAAQEAVAWFGSDVCPEYLRDNFERNDRPPPEEARAMLKGLSVTEEEIAERQEMFSEVMDVLRTLVGPLKGFHPPKRVMGIDRDEDYDWEPFSAYWQGRFTALTGVDTN